MKNKFIKCECGAHLLELSVEDFDGHGEKLIYVALWNYGHYGKMSFAQRLKASWRMLWKGDMHGDHVVLSRESAEEMNNYMQKEFSDEN
jgi:hypothetical protein